MSIDLLERGAEALGDLRNEVVFVGGATLGLWITDPGAPEIRPTYDVDVVVEVTSRSDYDRFEAKLREAGFRDEGTMIGRWLYGSDLILDAIPADATLLGFQNHWQQRAIPAAIARDLPSGTTIRVISPPYLVATKLEAFAGRGGQDYRGSRDFGDIVALIDGRSLLVEEISSADESLRGFLREELSALLGSERAVEGIYSHLRPDAASQARAEALVLPRIETIVAIE